MRTVAISGEHAADYKVISADSLMDLHKGKLLEADTMAGTFTWEDHVTHERRSARLPPRSIRIVRR